MRYDIRQDQGELGIMPKRWMWMPMGALVVVFVMAVAGQRAKQHSDWYEGTADHYYAQPGSYQPIGANHVN